MSSPPPPDPGGPWLWLLVVLAVAALGWFLAVVAPMLALLAP